MPCSDSNNWNHIEDYKSRNDKLAATICAQGRVLFKIYNNLTLTDDEERSHRKFVEEYVDHRKFDQNNATIAAQRELKKIDDNIEKIRSLGGEPRESLLKNRQAVLQLIINIGLEDPNTTTLY